jgi:hypothetical protein
MFQLYSHHQAYQQSLVELYVLNAYAMWDQSYEESRMPLVATSGIRDSS